ncbi:NAD(P)H-dependent oxidoreductase [Microbacterium sp. LjRoot45]|uniref:NADPH-dependent FMN reductase n=1 Tax=Microbacterium sp. LjRoot45 TaxID=3342329 RepID=UPI003ED1707C
MASVIVVVGNPQPDSRTRAVAETVAAELARRSGATVEPTIELAEIADELFRHPSPAVDDARARVLAADVAIVASPTYKATFTGLLKAFLDRFDTGSLQHMTAVPLLTIGGPAHALAVEVALRPLLVELGASVPTRGIAFPAGQVDRRAEIIAEWADAEWPRLRHALA